VEKFHYFELVLSLKLKIHFRPRSCRLLDFNQTANRIGIETSLFFSYPHVTPFVRTPTGCSSDGLNSGMFFCLWVFFFFFFLFFLFRSETSKAFPYANRDSPLPLACWVRNQLLAFFRCSPCRFVQALLPMICQVVIFPPTSSRHLGAGQPIIRSSFDPPHSHAGPHL